MLGRLLLVTCILLAPAAGALGPVPFRICDLGIRPGTSCDEVSGAAGDGDCTTFSRTVMGCDEPEAWLCLFQSESPKYWCGVGDLIWRCPNDVASCLP